jgi:hypothetical protein
MKEQRINAWDTGDSGAHAGGNGGGISAGLKTII